MKIVCWGCGADLCKSKRFYPKVTFSFIFWFLGSEQLRREVLLLQCKAADGTRASRLLAVIRLISPSLLLRTHRFTDVCVALFLQVLAYTFECASYVFRAMSLVFNILSSAFHTVMCARALIKSLFGTLFIFVYPRWHFLAWYYQITFT